MNELKLYVDDLEDFERRLGGLGGKMEEPCRFGNWYLETTAVRVLKVVKTKGQYSLSELRKRKDGFEFIRNEPIDDIGPFRLQEVAAHNVLHKIERRWTVEGRVVDVIVFDDIGVFACIYYHDGGQQAAQDFIRTKLKLEAPRYLEAPFNVVKRRRLGVPDFDAV